MAIEDRIAEVVIKKQKNEPVIPDFSFHRKKKIGAIRKVQFQKRLRYDLNQKNEL